MIPPKAERSVRWCQECCHFSDEYGCLNCGEEIFPKRIAVIPKRLGLRSKDKIILAHKKISEEYPCSYHVTEQELIEIMDNLP